ncbi:hypothetical protein CPAR01_15327, partial [Colletotrichum paranaense]
RHSGTKKGPRTRPFILTLENCSTIGLVRDWRKCPSTLQHVLCDVITDIHVLGQGASTDIRVRILIREGGWSLVAISMNKNIVVETAVSKRVPIMLKFLLLKGICRAFGRQELNKRKRRIVEGR